MELIEFPYEQLGKHLKCTDCHNLLSVPPIVVLKETGEYKCGRCSITGEDRTGKYNDWDWECRLFPKKPAYKNAVRDLPYEELAKDVLFPCHNRKYGCGEYHKCEPPVVYEFRVSYVHSVYCRTPIHCHTYHDLICFGTYPDIPSLIKHYQSKHREQICQKKWHSNVITIPKESEKENLRIFFSSDNKIIFFLQVDKTGLEFTFTLRSFGTSQAFQFEIKPCKFRNKSSKRGETLLSTPVPNANAELGIVKMPSEKDPRYFYKSVNTSVKLVVMQEDEELKEYEFQLDFVGKVKPRAFKKIPVRESDVLKCAKCHKYLSVKPIVATKSGFECGYCFKTTEGAKVRMKAYETLAEMVLFPCEEPGCEKSFGISEMKKHRDTHNKSSESKNIH